MACTTRLGSRHYSDTDSYYYSNYPNDDNSYSDYSATNGSSSRCSCSSQHLV